MPKHDQPFLMKKGGIQKNIQVVPKFCSLARYAHPLHQHGWNIYSSCLLQMPNKEKRKKVECGKLKSFLEICTLQFLKYWKDEWFLAGEAYPFWEPQMQKESKCKCILATFCRGRKTDRLFVFPFYNVSSLWERIKYLAASSLIWSLKKVNFGKLSKCWWHSKWLDIQR